MKPAVRGEFDVMLKPRVEQLDSIASVGRVFSYACRRAWLWLPQVPPTESSTWSTLFGGTASPSWLAGRAADIDLAVDPAAARNSR